MHRALCFCFKMGSHYLVPYYKHSGYVTSCPQKGIQGFFSSHNFYISAASIAARNGISDHQIQALGRWTSSAYLLHIPTPADLFQGCLSSSCYLLLDDCASNIGQFCLWLGIVSLLLWFDLLLIQNRLRTHFFTFQFTRSLETTNFLSTAVWPIEPIKCVCKRTEQIFMSDCQLVPVQFQYRRKGVALEVDWEHQTAEGGGSQDCTHATTWVQLASLPLIQ